MRGTETSCVREMIVGNRRSGCSETSRKSVFSKGSSRILRILLAASSFIASGSQISIVFSSASRAAIMPLSVLPRSSRSYQSCAEK